MLSRAVMRARCSGISRYELGDSARGLVHGAFDQGQINLLHLARRELQCKIAMGRVRLRHQQNATGETVEAMYDAGTQIAADGRERLEAMQQGVDDGSGMDTRPRVDYHAGGLIDDDGALILIKNREGDGFGGGMERRQGGWFQMNCFRAAQLVGRLLRGGRLR